MQVVIVIRRKSNTERKERQKKLTILLLYFNDDNHLSHQVNSWQQYSSEVLNQIQFLIVDDGTSKRKSAESFFKRNMVKKNFLDLRLLKINQSINWNIGGARNLGFFEAYSDWVFMIDGDTIVKPKTIEFVLRNLQSPTNVYIFFERIRADRKTDKPHPAVMLLAKESYWKNGGCDEDFVGNYGYTDPHFRYRLGLELSLNMIKFSIIMKRKNIPPLEELSKTIACHQAFQCSDSGLSEQLSRNTNPNKILFEEKKKNKFVE